MVSTIHRMAVVVVEAPDEISACDAAEYKNEILWHLKDDVEDEIMGAIPAPDQSTPLGSEIDRKKVPCYSDVVRR